MGRTLMVCSQLKLLRKALHGVRMHSSLPASVYHVISGETDAVLLFSQSDSVVEMACFEFLQRSGFIRRSFYLR